MNSTSALYQKLHRAETKYDFWEVCLEVPSDTNQPDLAKPRVFLTSKTLF